MNTYVVRATEEPIAESLTITTRDTGILQLAHEERFLVYEQIKNTFWSGSTKEGNTAHRRLRRLVKEGYLKKEWSRYISENLYTLGEQGYPFLKERNLHHGLELYPFRPDRDDKYVDHHIKVTNIRLLFRAFGLERWTSERILRERDRSEFVPDGVLDLRGDKIAIEYENRLKSRERYIRRFKFYADANVFILVIFVLGKPKRQWLIDLDYKLDQVCFVEYRDLLRMKEEAYLENKVSGFVLAEVL